MFGQGFAVFAVMTYAVSNARPDDGDKVELNPPYLASVFGEEVGSVEAAINYLCSKDAGSRSPEHGGRRLLRTDQPFTFIVVNLTKYRNGDIDEVKREFWRNEKAKQREKRAKKKNVQGQSGTNQDSPGNVLHTDAAATAATTASAPAVDQSVPPHQRGGGVGKNNIFETEPPKGFPKTLKEAESHASFVGCPVAFVSKAWNKAVSRGCEDSAGRPIRSFRHYLATEWSYEQGRKGKGGSNPAANPCDPFSREGDL